jgi:hypothetical protein
MRLAPVPIHYANHFPDDLERLWCYLVESSLPTHASRQCLTACGYFGLVLCGLIHGQDRQEVLTPDWEPLRRIGRMQALHPEVEEVAAGSFCRKKPPELHEFGLALGLPWPSRRADAAQAVQEVPWGAEEAERAPSPDD